MTPRARRRGPRKHRARILLTLAVLATAAAGPLPVQEGSRAAPAAVARPNVLLIVTDDATISDLAALPTVRRRIGELGTRFTRALSANPVCCPARASLLTGQHSHNHGVQTNVAPYGGWALLDDVETLPVWLQRAGYTTMMLGKYLNLYDRPPGSRGRRYVPPGWSEWHVPVVNAYHFRSYTMNHNGSLRDHRTYQTTLWRRTAVDLIEKHAARRRPFFLWAGFLAPHSGGPVEPDDPKAVTGDERGVPTPAVLDRDRDAYSDLRLPAKASFGEPDLSDKPALARSVRPMRARWEYREALIQRRQSLRAVDRAVGAMLNAVAASGELRRTLVIFTSDNGYLLGEHRVVGKIVGYEESVRVPLLVRGPGFAPRARRSQLVSLSDLPSTIARATGATPTLPQDGRPLQPFSADADAGASRAMLLQGGPRPSSGERRWYTGVRTSDDRVLLRWYTGDTELYDLDEDPLQLDGAISGSETEEDHDALVRRLDALEDCRGISCDG